MICGLTAVVACGPPAEYTLLQQFFAASRLRDTTALQSLATVIFEPREQGVVTEFTITHVAQRRENGRAVKEVTVSAPVRALTGETAQRTLFVRLAEIDGGWKVVQIR